MSDESVSRKFFEFFVDFLQFSENDSVAARILLLMSIPGHLIFVTTIILIGGISFSVYFIVAYLIAAVAQVSTQYIFCYVCCFESLFGSSG